VIRPGVRARWSLAAAGTLGLSVGAVGASALLLDGGPAAAVTFAVAAVCVAAGVPAGAVPALRRVSAAVLTGAAAAAAVGVAAALGLLAVPLALGHLPTGAERGMGTPLLVGVLVAAVLAGPLARRAARAARAGLQGRRRSPDELLDAFAGSGGTDTDELLRGLAEALRREHRLARVEIWSAAEPAAAELHRTLVVPDRGDPAPAPLDKAELALLARSGVAGPGWLRLWLPRLLDHRDAAQVRLAPAVHAGEVLALAVVERAGDADLFTAADERALAEVVRRLAVVLRNRALDEALAVTLDDLRRANTDLQASRARLVSTADAERRRIERDLHDGAQQHLVAIAVGLRLVRDGATDPADVELLDELDRGVRESIAALRDLAHGIYPPLLRDAGLPDALRAAVTRSPQPVEVRATAVGRHPEPVEAAVYFCCLEALQNAAKHASGAPVLLTLEVRDGALRFEVTDRGPGFDTAGVEPGAGRQNMADRLGAVGGSVRWSSEPGRGTTVTGSVPV
jgi:signal transduction histidine kinase